MENFEVKYIFDSDVDDILDRKFREALFLCFPKQIVFEKQRFYKELPQHRWYVEVDNKIVAHVAVHDLEINTEKGNIKVAGIAEVLVNPDFRKRGLAKLLLEQAHTWATQNNFDFAMLYGDKKVYCSSGYLNINNQIKYLDHESNEWKIETFVDAMVKQLGGIIWPEGVIDLNGPTF